MEGKGVLGLSKAPERGVRPGRESSQPPWSPPRVPLGEHPAAFAACTCSSACRFHGERQMNDRGGRMKRQEGSGRCRVKPGGCQGAGALPGLEPLRAPPLPQELCPWAPRGWLKGKTTPREAADFPPRFNNHLLPGKKQSSPSASHPCQGTGTRGAARPGPGVSVGSGGTGKPK